MEQNTLRTIIGLTGEPSSGKDTVAAYLVETYGFKNVSTGDMLRFYVAEHQLGDSTRDRLREVGNFLRAEHGADYLARLALQRPERKLIVSGLRNPAEVQAIKNEGGVLIALRASMEIRYQRAKERGRIGDEISFEVFKEQEEAEEVSLNPNAQLVAEVMAMADFELNNDGTLDDLRRQADELMGKLVQAN